MQKITLLNHANGGEELEIELPDDQEMTLGEVLEDAGIDLNATTFRVNRGPGTPDRVLQDGDRVSAVPTKVKDGGDIPG